MHNVFRSKTAGIKQKCCTVLMRRLRAFCCDTEWSPLNVNTVSQMVKLLWLRGKDDISIMLSQHRGLGQEWWRLCPVPKSSLCLLVSINTGLKGKKKEKKMCGGHFERLHQISWFNILLHRSTPQLGFFFKDPFPLS